MDKKEISRRRFLKKIVGGFLAGAAVAAGGIRLREGITSQAESSSEQPNIYDTLAKLETDFASGNMNADVLSQDIAKILEVLPQQTQFISNIMVSIMDLQNSKYVFNISYDRNTTEIPGSVLPDLSNSSNFDFLLNTNAEVVNANTGRINMFRNIYSNHSNGDIEYFSVLGYQVRQTVPATITCNMTNRFNNQPVHWYEYEEVYGQPAMYRSHIYDLEGQLVDASDLPKDVSYIPVNEDAVIAYFEAVDINFRRVLSGKEISDPEMFPVPPSKISPVPAGGEDGQVT